MLEGLTCAAGHMLHAWHACHDQGHKRFVLEAVMFSQSIESSCCDVPQVEVAIKRAPLEERKKKRKQQLQEEVGEGHAEGAEAADVGPTQEQQHQQQQPAKKARPAKPAAAPAAAGKQGGGSEEKHRMTRAVAVGQLTPETVNAAIKLAQAAGEVGAVWSLLNSPAIFLRYAPCYYWSALGLHQWN